MEIRTPRLCLKPLCMEHLASAYRYSSDPEGTRFMMFLPAASREEVAAFIRDAEAERAKPSPEYYEMAVLRDGEHIGGVSLHLERDGRSAEMGWILRRDCWGRGYATEAARALMAHARSAWGIRRFVAHCDAENAASAGVMRRLGMRCTGRAGGRKNRSSDEERYELTYEVTLDG